MTDREQFEAICKRARIVVDVQDPMGERTGSYADTKYPWPVDGALLTVSVGKAQPYYDGYGGFFSTFTFDVDGALLSIGAWE
jgi:hypothetical protein